MVYEAEGSSGLERRAVLARRRAHSGDIVGAEADFAALWPESKCLRPGRRIRFLSQYAGVLGRRQCVLDFERIRLLAEEAERLWKRMDSQREEARTARRHLHGVLQALLKVVRKVGDESAIGQTGLQHIWALASALDSQNGADANRYRALKENGKTIWITNVNGRYRLLRLDRNADQAAQA